LEFFSIVAFNISAVLAISASEKGSPNISPLSRALLISPNRAAAEIHTTLIEI